MQGLLAALKILHATYSLHQSSILGLTKYRVRILSGNPKQELQ